MIMRITQEGFKTKDNDDLQITVNKAVKRKLGGGKKTARMGRRVYICGYESSLA